jgi:hypothetical protein
MSEIRSYFRRYYGINSDRGRYVCSTRRRPCRADTRSFRSVSFSNGGSQGPTSSLDWLLRPVRDRKTGSHVRPLPVGAFARVDE